MRLRKGEVGRSEGQPDNRKPEAKVQHRSMIVYRIAGARCSTFAVNWAAFGGRGIRATVIAARSAFTLEPLPCFAPVLALAALSLIACPPSGRRRLAAGQGAADDPLGEGRFARQGPSRISAAADGPRESGRTSTACGTTPIRRRHGRGAAGNVRRQDPRAVPDRVGPLGRDEARRPERQLWYRRTFSARRLEGRRPAAAALRRGRLALRQSRSTARKSARTPAATTRSRSTSPTPWRRTRPSRSWSSLVVRSDRRQLAAARQASPQARRASGTRRRPASGRRCGWRRCRRRHIERLQVVPDVDDGRSASPCECRHGATGPWSRSPGRETSRSRRWMRPCRGHRAGRRQADRHRRFRDAEALVARVARSSTACESSCIGETSATATQSTATSRMRKISLGKDEHGVTRMMLNNKPVFQFGPLDQGFWPDGLYTAPTDEALKYDLEVTKKLGFNMVRKHVKVEPARWYYYCDKLGLLVWQDMPSGDKHAPWNPIGGHNGKEIERSKESADNFRAEWKAIIDDLLHFPVDRHAGCRSTKPGASSTRSASPNWTMQHDPARLVNCASGGNDFPVGHISDLHRYPGPDDPRARREAGRRARRIRRPGPAARRAHLASQGQLGLPHVRDQGGARTPPTSSSSTSLRPLIGKGLSAAIYTQTTDVEVEVNGFMTYDRAVIKLDPEQTAALHKKLYRAAAEGDRRRAHVAGRSADLALHDRQAGRRLGEGRFRRRLVEGRPGRLRRAEHARQQGPHRVENARHLAAPDGRAAGRHDRLDQAWLAWRSITTKTPRSISTACSIAAVKGYTTDYSRRAARREGAGRGAQARRERPRRPLQANRRRAVHRRGAGAARGGCAK